MVKLICTLLCSLLPVTFVVGKPFYAQKLPEPLSDQDYIESGERGITAKIELGRALFFDKILSGNQNISCATCHHPMAGSSDGWSLPVGEGGAGLGVTRNTGLGEDAIEERVPRNSPALFNLGAKEFTQLFHDGRAAVDLSHPSGFLSPAGNDLPLGLENMLAVQAMFPITSGTEMAGQPGENTQADLAAANDLPGLWSFVAEKLKSIEEYVEMFNQAFGIGREEITMVHAANAIAAFESVTFRSDDSPFDRYLKGEDTLTRQQKRGMRLFYGKAGCVDCHSGPLQTDQSFHSIAMPQIGNGKGDGVNGREDFGRMRVTGEEIDKYRFRTPSLRNLSLTAPYGHAGAYDDLEDVVRHHLDPVYHLENYDLSKSRLAARDDLDAIDGMVMNDSFSVQSIADANELRSIYLRERQVEALIAFLGALNDQKFLDMRSIVPKRVPSGLPLFD